MKKFILPAVYIAVQFGIQSYAADLSNPLGCKQLADFQGSWANGSIRKLSIETLGCSSVQIGATTKKGVGSIQLDLTGRAQSLSQDSPLLPTGRGGQAAVLGNVLSPLLYRARLIEVDGAPVIQVDFEGEMQVREKTETSFAPFTPVKAKLTLVLSIKKKQYFDGLCGEMRERKKLTLWIGGIKLRKASLGKKALVDSILRSLDRVFDSPGPPNDVSKKKGLEDLVYFETLDFLGGQ